MRPSRKFQTLYDRFQNTILSQQPRIPCVYHCGRLLYLRKSFLDPSITYPLQQRIPGVSLSFNPNVSRIRNLRVPTCEPCKKPSTRFLFPHLSPYPRKYFPFLTSQEEVTVTCLPSLFLKKSTK
jgi:hypothetical protein